MQNGQNSNMTRRQPRPAAPHLTARSGGHRTSSRPAQSVSHNAKRNYERYLTLAQSEAQAGDKVAAENYYQHAEHYFRMMSSAGEAI